MQVPGLKGEVYLHITLGRRREFGWDGYARLFNPGGEYKASTRMGTWCEVPTICKWGMHGSKSSLFAPPRAGNWISVVRIWGDVNTWAGDDKVVGRRRKYVATRQIKTANSAKMLWRLSNTSNGVAIAQWVLEKPYNGIIAAGYTRKG